MQMDLFLMASQEHAAQATTLDNLLSEKGTSISAMLSLKVEDEELIRRLLSRGESSGRADDQDKEYYCKSELMSTIIKQLH